MPPTLSSLVPLKTMFCDNPCFFSVIIQRCFQKPVNYFPIYWDTLAAWHSIYVVFKCKTIHKQKLLILTHIFREIRRNCWYCFTRIWGKSSAVWRLTPLGSGCWRGNWEHWFTRANRTFSRADSRFAPSQWETAFLFNDVSHWLGANLE